MNESIRFNSSPRRARRRIAGPLICAAVAVLCGCRGPFQSIDRRTNALLTETSADMRAAAPEFQSEQYRERVIRPRTDSTDATELATTNPPADELSYSPSRDAESVITRLDAYAEPRLDAIVMSLADVLSYAMDNSREYRFAAEEYVLSALRLLIERHQWGPRFFDEFSAFATALGDDALFESSLALVNEFRVTQRLPYGGSVSARALATASEDLHLRVAGENVQSAAIILEADVPLLRGAGLAARESRIQAERDLIYSAREFERFRREFAFDIARDFLDLVVQKQAITNAERQVKTFEELEARQRALVEAGREPPFEAALAAQDTLFARDRLNSQREAYRLSLDRFKVRLGMPVDTALEIETTSLDLPAPDIDADEAVRIAMMYRLDLQTSRDALDDARRGVDISRNATLPDLDLSGSVTIPTDDERDRQGLLFDLEDPVLVGGVTFGLPLDREIERLAVRQSQIDLERANREYERFRDSVAVDVRASLRQIDAARFSLQLQEENIRIARLRRASIDAAPDRATARDRSEAVDDLLRAEDDRDRSRRDLQVAILQYLLQTDQLRIGPDGSILALPGMQSAANGQPAPPQGG